MERDKKLNRYLEEEFVYMKAMEKAKTYKSSDGIDTINLKDIDPEKVDYKGIDYIKKDDGTVFEKADFEITLPNGEKTILTVDKNGNDISCNFIDEDGKSQVFLLTPDMQARIMKQAVDDKIQGNIDTQTLQEALFPNSPEEMEKAIKEDTLIPKSAEETIEKVKAKNPNADIEEVKSEEMEKDAEEQDIEKGEDLEKTDDETEEELELPENIKDVVEEIKETDGSSLKHVLITKNPSSVADQLMDSAGINENGEPVYCLQFKNGDLGATHDRVVIVQGEKVIDEPRYYEDASRFMDSYKNSNVVENVEDNETKIYYTDIHGHTIVADMKTEPRDLNSIQKQELAEKLAELSSQEKAIKAQDKPLTEKLEDLQKINGKRLELFDEYGLDVQEIRNEIQGDYEIREDIQGDIEEMKETREEEEEDQELNEDDGRDPRESSHTRYLE